jgi:hypothetical protein
MKTKETEENPFQNRLAGVLKSEREALLDHPLYGCLRTVEDLAVFMQHHVFAVWDFMSLLKALQRRLTCTSIPWRPQGDGKVRRLVNEIVLGEESDVLPNGEVASHFELYLQAMKEVGAETAAINRFIHELENGQSVMGALTRCGVSEAVAAFVRSTFEVIARGQPHEVAAAFTYGREDLIPERFTQLVNGLERQFPGKLATLRYYLDRHIELDGEEHGEMGRQMVDLLCDGDPIRERQAVTAAVEALRSRHRLWDAIALELETSGAVAPTELALATP